MTLHTNHRTTDQHNSHPQGETNYEQSYIGGVCDGQWCCSGQLSVVLVSDVAMAIGVVLNCVVVGSYATLVSGVVVVSGQ